MADRLPARCAATGFLRLMDNRAGGVLADNGGPQADRVAWQF
ncbi:MAG: hypothetical protein WCK63_16530 [Betaproteobacteria bacterium]